ncbi:metallophosphoesterase [Sporosarcina sp. BI001-red]|uniref:metallophosphoesterase family protein n=1 Tax=Sporosarcina sp. BI001-red TaxID=2282866 RepID=UPI000E28A312|nr:metallophosphoesterase [Sporosarcina sp. BI001-red]REB08026.1 metallophosphoesterase [Sporosarcina sp. BI001-red]
MKVIITGDTHIPGRGSKLPSRLLNACNDADLIIHTGDWCSPEVFKTLSSLAEVKGVYGNVDGEEMRALVPAQQLINIGGLRMGLVHGHGDKKTTEQRAVEAFAEEQVDVIVFGHSHIPVIKYFKGRLLMNPGSPTDKRKLPFYSFITLEIGDEIRPELILFRDKS